LKTVSVDIRDIDPRIVMRSCLQKVATGPELSKDLSFEEAHAAMACILDKKVDAVQAGVFLIALRMKRETDDENKAILRAILDASDSVVAAVDEVVDVADPYDGFSRGLPMSPFLPAVLAACGVSCVSHGLESVGPKFGITHRHVLRAAGIDVDLTPMQAAARIEHPDIGWAYVDQRASCPKLHDLVGLRNLIVKRPAITTVEVLTGPVRGRRQTHLMTGYVHKAYPRIYGMLARYVGFDSALLVRGVEGGIIPSLQHPSRVFHCYGDDEPQLRSFNPMELDIKQSNRAVPIPGEITSSDADSGAMAAAEMGLQALAGKPGPAYDSLVYGTTLALVHLRHHSSLTAAAETVRTVLNTGAPLARFRV
jgi:anthranilate phosphoribosyltransferase